MDAGLVPTTDAGLPQGDAGVAPSLSLPVFEENDNSFGGEIPGETSKCFDGSDNDDDPSSGVDCSAAGCRDLASCCLDSGRCCDVPTYGSLNLDCAELESCVSRGAIFGSPTPYLSEGRFYPGGDGRFDSGVVLTDLDLRSERVEVSAAYSMNGGCGNCLETLALAVTDAPPEPGAVDAHVHPLVAMQLTEARNEMLFIIDGRIARRLPFSAATWTLRLEPTGRAVLLRDATVVAEAPFLPKPATLVLHGHGRNPGAEHPGIHLSSLAWSVSRCPMLSRFGAGQPISFARDTSVGAMSLAVTDIEGQTIVGLASGDDVELSYHRGDALEASEFVISGDAPSYRGLALQYDDELIVYRLAELPEGTALVRGRSTDGTIVLDDYLSDPLRTNLEGVEEFSVLEHRGHLILVVARTDSSAEETGESIVSAYLRGPKTEGHWRHLGLRFLLAGRHPNLSLAGGRYELRYEVRSGSRRQIALAVSDDLVGWRSFGATQSEGARSTAAFRFGIGSPALYESTDDRRLYFLGEDGLQGRLGWSRQP